MNLTDLPDYGDWGEDYHHCYGEYACEAVGGLCPLEDSVNFERARRAAREGRGQRPRTVCPTCGQETGLAVRKEKQ